MGTQLWSTGFPVCHIWHTRTHTRPHAHSCVQTHIHTLVPIRFTHTSPDIVWMARQQSVTVWSFWQVHLDWDIFILVHTNTRVTHLPIQFNVCKDGDRCREAVLVQCRSLSRTKQADSTFLQWVCIGKEINTPSSFRIFHGVKESGGADTVQQCVALPKVGVLKSQIICFWNNEIVLLFIWLG